jgi:hypothetical protein
VVILVLFNGFNFYVRLFGLFFLFINDYFVTSHRRSGGVVTGESM